MLSQHRQALGCLETVCHDRGTVLDKKEGATREMYGSRHHSGRAGTAGRVEGKAEPPSTDPDLDTPTQAEALSCIAKLRYSVVKMRPASAPQN